LERNRRVGAIGDELFREVAERPVIARAGDEHRPLTHRCLRGNPGRRD
jgi:hypothetical protein